MSAICSAFSALGRGQTVPVSQTSGGTCGLPGIGIVRWETPVIVDAAKRRQKAAARGFSSWNGIPSARVLRDDPTGQLRGHATAAGGTGHEELAHPAPWPRAAGRSCRATRPRPPHHRAVERALRRELPDGRLCPGLELGHHPWKRDREYEDYLGRRGLDKYGKKRWNKLLQEAIEQTFKLFNWDHLYLGGGNTKKITFKPGKNVEIVPNEAGLLGGVALWREWD